MRNLKKILPSHMTIYCYLVLTLMAHSVYAVEVQPELTAKQLASSNPDECFMGKGSEGNYINANGLTSDEVTACVDNGGTLKYNRGYLWGMTSAEQALWFGTGSNIVPTGFGAILEAQDSDRDLESLVPAMEFQDMVLEFAKSTYKNGELGILGDFRPPRIFTYALETGALTDITPDDPLIEKTYGIRSAGNLNGVVLMAGPCMDKELLGINVFAFNAKTREFLGSTCLRTLVNAQGETVAKEINNIRKWLVVDHVLYTAIGTATGGCVLRWKGSLSSPFLFDVVGDLEDQGTDLVLHENRLFVFTWPSAEDYTGVTTEFNPDKVCSIWMTKDVMPEGGLTAGTEFVKVWTVSDYEPDPVTASTYGLGAAASYGGYLYWGTMHVPLAGGAAKLRAYPGDFRRPANLLEAFFFSNRQSAVFRAKNVASGTPEIDLLYGEDRFFRYKGDGRWEDVPNNMNAEPLYGSSGFGSRSNFYLWTMAEYNGQLYAGTFDGSFPEEDEDMMPSLFNMFLNFWVDNIPNQVDLSLLINLFRAPDNIPGGDLFKFPDAHSSAVAETIDCFGYQGTYGFRNLMVVDGTLYAGTASSFNLNPDGGWKLLELKEDPNTVE